MIENELDRIDTSTASACARWDRLQPGEHARLGLSEDRDGGLTHFGRRAVDRMNKLGIAIDISHSGDRTSLDVD